MRKSIKIAKREFLNFFNQPVGYVFFIAFVAVSYFLFFRNIFVLGFATIRPYTENIPIILSLLIPALVMGSISQEKREKTIEIVFTSPVSILEFALGKFLGNYAVYALMLFSTLSIPLSLSFFGKFDFGIIFTSYLGILLLGSMFVSVGIFVSSLSDNQVISFIVSIFIILAFVLFGSQAVTFSLPPFLASLVFSFGALGHLDSFNKGVIDLRDLIYFLSFTALFLFLVYYMLSKDRFIKRKFLSYTFKTTLIVLFVGTIVLNYISQAFFVRLDLTKDKVYTTSPFTKEILRSLPDSSLLKFYYSKDLPPEFSERKGAILDILTDFSRVSGSNLKIEYKEIVSGSQEESVAVNDGVAPVQFNTLSNDEFAVKKGFLGLVVLSGEKTEPIPFVESSDGLEYQIASLVRKISDIEKKKVGFLEDGNSLSLFTDLNILRNGISEYYEYTTISLTSEDLKEEKSIPEDIDVLAIVGPKTELDLKVIENINKFVQSGKPVVIFADSYDVSIDTLLPIENSLSINNFLSQYGVEIKKGIVYDLLYSERINVNQGFFNIALPYPYFSRNVLTDQSASLLGNIQSVLNLWGSSLETKEIIGVKTIPIIATSPKSYLDMGTVAQEGGSALQFDLRPDKQFSQTNLASLLTGVLLEGDDTNLRVLIIANDDLLKDQYYQANTDFVLNSFDLAVNDKSFISVRSKSSMPERLVFTSDTAKNSVKYGNMIGLPLAIGLFALIRLKYRGSKSQN